MLRARVLLTFRPLATCTWGLVAVVTWLGSCTWHARAEEPARAELTFSAQAPAVGCPSELELKRAVAAQLGYWPFDPPFDKHVRARIALDGSGLEGVVELTNASGEPSGSRHLASPTRDCSELSAALELAISIAIDPTILARPPAESPPPAAPLVSPASEPAPPIQTAAAEPPPAGPTTPHVQTPPPAEKVHVRGAMGALLSVGSLPAPHAAFTAQVEVQRKALVLALEGRVDLPAEKAAKDGGSVEASLFAGSLLACGRFGWFGVCGVTSLGALLGRGVDLARTDRNTSLFAALGLRASADVKLHERLALRPFVEPMAVLSRTTLRVGGRDVWTSPPATFALGLAVVGRLR